MRDMAESAQLNRARRWRVVTMVTVLIAVVAATGALAATVTERPTISGSPLSGETLTATTGSWTPASATAEYTWLQCDAGGIDCLGITGACGRKYQVRSADENHRLRVRLTVTESNGQAAFADSDPSALVVPDPYRPNVGAGDTCTHVTPTGPAKGTFNSGTQTGGGSQPTPGTTLSFIKPFPVIRIAGRFKGAR